MRIILDLFIIKKLTYTFTWQWPKTMSKRPLLILFINFSILSLTLVFNFWVMTVKWLHGLSVISPASIGETLSKCQNNWIAPVYSFRWLTMDLFCQNLDRNSSLLRRSPIDMKYPNSVKIFSQYEFFSNGYQVLRNR